ncbi:MULTISPECIES: ankyrin repeat domain-containing protein [unclassified Amycolatopsis]|uniref:ankyrin repeat domain-containing protein n=1 Tax=unclassified Amycolatopsis TaxID=2618356 RepID=UPI002876246B|nr:MULTISPECIES: ankyrin repeat domain-containing protein [unclassified Amycolatopsis]MDS0138214.1 ankyrin repeat domain-containing protein [Amycolatopsis sp. 505]MDS0149165.1 ankyrin repeat domain-containing protein [Amycolatopsis sp. CM201R]
MGTLPAKPSLDQLRKRAKELARAEGVKLAEAQFRIARDHGFPSWPKLRAYVRRVTEHGEHLQHPYHQDVEYYAERALGLLASAEDDTPGAKEPFDRWSRPLTRDGARAVVAHEHGFGSWKALREHVRSLVDSGEPFARAYRAIEDRDPDRLETLLDEFPGLVDARGTNGNDLLGMAGATHDERLSRILLDHGADPARGNVHGWTPLHQAAYSNLPLLLDLLLQHGAPVDVSARGDGGTPLVVALFWGHRAAAEKLAEHSHAPGNLRVAAGLGDVDAVDDVLTSGRGGEHRGFYRPHSGFPAWQPADDPVEVRNEALSWAARNDRADALRTLVARGADVNADVYRGTALAWAAASGKLAAVRTLLELGADVNFPGTFGGPNHGEGVTALHLAAQSGHLDVIRVLVESGADPGARDAIFGSTPETWAEVCGQPAARDLLR